MTDGECLFAGEATEQDEGELQRPLRPYEKRIDR